MTTPSVPEAHLTAWRSLLNAHATVTERVEKALRASGLPPLTWYDVLWALRRAPDRKLRMGELAESVTLSRGGLTKLVDRLEAAGLLRRESCATDRRGYDAILTDAGNDMLRRMWPVYEGALRDAFVAHLADDDAEQIAGLLARIADPAAATELVVAAEG